MNVRSLVFRYKVVAVTQRMGRGREEPQRVKRSCRILQRATIAKKSGLSSPRNSESALKTFGLPRSRKQIVKHATPPVSIKGNQHQLVMGMEVGQRMSLSSN